MLFFNIDFQTGTDFKTSFFGFSFFLSSPQTCHLSPKSICPFSFINAFNSSTGVVIATDDYAIPDCGLNRNDILPSLGLVLLTIVQLED